MYIDDITLCVDRLIDDRFYMVDLIKNNLEYDDLSFMKKCHARAFWNFLVQDKDGDQVEPESADTEHVIWSESEQ